MGKMKDLCRETGLCEDEKEVSTEDEVAPEREYWGSQTEFILSCVGYTVGLGNVVRFPYLVFKNGGGAFLIPYILILITCGTPMFLMEVALGQYLSQGPIGTWRTVCPLFTGIGYAMLVASFLVSIYYNVLVSWVFFYLFSSFQSDVPWRNCDPAWSTPHCFEGARPRVAGNGTVFNVTLGSYVCAEGLSPVYESVKNITNNTTNNLTEATNWSGKCQLNDTERIYVFPSEEFFSNNMLQITESIDELGGISWQLFLCLTLAWIVVYFCMWKGVKSSGKVVYFTATFPYLVLLILLVRGLTLDNAIEGVIYYLRPDFNKLLSPEVWSSAASQLFYSLGPAFGTLLSFSSYNRFNNNCVRDAIFVSFMDVFTSTMAGLVIFSVLGFMAGRLNIDIQDVAQHGPGLAFMIYPEGIAQMPLSSFWAILFFFMLFTLGLDSMFGMMECVVTSLIDEYPQYLRKRKELFILAVCIVAYLCGILLTTQGGMYWYNLFDYQSAGTGLIGIALIEVLVVGWVFDADRLMRMMEEMLERKPSKWWRFSIKFISPLVLTLMFLIKVVKWQGVSYGEYSYPVWAEVVGWMMALASIGCIPLFALVTVLRIEKDKSIIQALKEATFPNVKVIEEKALINGSTSKDPASEHLFDVETNCV